MCPLLVPPAITAFNRHCWSLRGCCQRDDSQWRAPDPDSGECFRETGSLCLPSNFIVPSLLPLRTKNLPASSDAKEGWNNDPPPPRADRAAHPSHMEANSPSRPLFLLSCHVSSWDNALVTGTTCQGGIRCKVRRGD